MRRNPLSTYAYHSFGVLQFLSVVALALIGVGDKTDDKFLQSANGVIRESLLFLKSIDPYYRLVFPILIAVLEGVRKLMGPPWAREFIHSFLDGIQSMVFTDRKSSELHHHRVTLFRRVPARVCFTRKWYADWFTPWLVPFSRSAHTTQRARTSFRVPDSGDDAEGIAGATWNCKNIISIDSLPDLAINEPSPSQIHEYAEKKRVT